MPNANAEVVTQTPEVEHAARSLRRQEQDENSQINVRAALPAEGSSEDPLKVRTERDRLLEVLGRSQAELENTCKRAARERQELSDNTLIEVARSLLPILDSFEQALRHIGDVEQFRSGIALIYRQLLDVLKRLGVEQIPPQAEDFNPQYQESNPSGGNDRRQRQSGPRSRATRLQGSGSTSAPCPSARRPLRFGTADTGGGKAIEQGEVATELGDNR